jgi:streptogramin lyase
LPELTAPALKRTSQSLSGSLSPTLGTIYFLLFFLTNFITALSQSADYMIKSYSTDIGLAHPTVKWIARDSSGFLWIGTFDGLSRFDGNDFLTYRHTPDDPSSLPPNEARKIFVDKFNTVWILSSHVVRFDRSSEKFISYFNAEKGSPGTTGVLDISVDHDGLFCILRNDGLMCYNNKKDFFYHVSLKNRDGSEVNSPKTGLLSFDGDGNMWILSSIWLDFYKRTKARQAGYIHSGKYRINKDFFYPVSTVQPEYQIIRSQKETYLISNFGVFKLDSTRMEFIYQRIEDGNFTGCRSFICGNDKQAIYFYDAAKNKPVKISGNGALQLGTSFLEHDGSFWISGLDKNRNWIGIRHLIPLKTTFHHYFDKFNEEQTAVFAIFQDENQGFWIGTRSKEHIIHLDKDGNFDKATGFNKKINAAQTRSRLSDPNVRAIQKDRLGNLWFGFLRDYLFYIDRKSQEFIQFLPDKKRNSIIGNKTNNRQILLLNNNMLLIGGDAGMFMVNPEIPEVVKTYSLAQTNGGLYALFQDDQGSIWTGNGFSILRKFDQQLNPLDSVRLNDGLYNLEGIAGNADTLWIASMGGGLIRYITRTHAVKSYSTRDGLPHNYTYHLIPDANKNLWISTNEGLSLFNPRTEIFTNFSEIDGLRIKEFNADAGFRANDGELFFGGMGGFVGFYPDSVYKMRRASSGRLLFTDFSVSGIKREFSKPIYELDTIVLTKGDNNFQVTFAALDFNFPETIKYRYKLEGIENKWNLANSGNRHANYAGISYGRYRFLVETANESGNWSGRKVLVIMIPAFIYQTAGFNITIILLILLIIFMFLWMKYKQIRLENLRKRESLRMQALQSQLNPHFIFNALNSVSYLISHKPKETADQFVADFASLMRSFLNNSSKDFILLGAEIDSIKHYLDLEHLRIPEKFDYVIEYPEDLEIDGIEVVPSLVQPFVENAIWHGVGLLNNRKGSIVLRFSQSSPKFITCVVEDNGIGRVKAGRLKSSDYTKRQSKGVSLVHDRLNIINSMFKSNFQIITEDLCPGMDEPGTKVSIPIPVRSFQRKKRRYDTEYNNR